MSGLRLFPVTRKNNQRTQSMKNQQIRICSAAVIALLLSPLTSYGFSVHAEAAVNVAGMPDVFGYCDFADDKNRLTCDTGQVVNTNKGTSWASAFASLSQRKIRFVASAGEDGVSTTGGAWINAFIDDTYRLKTPRSEDTTIDVRVTITGSVNTNMGPQAAIGQSRVDFGGTRLDNQNFPGDQIVFDGAEFFAYSVVIPAFDLGEIPIFLDFTAQVSTDAVADFTNTVSVDFFGPDGVELIADSGVEVTLGVVPVPHAALLFASGLALLGWCRRRVGGA